MHSFLALPAVTLGLRLLAFLALLFGCLAPELWAVREASDTVVLIDRSLSVPPQAVEVAWADVLRQRAAAKGRRVTSLFFAGAVAPAAQQDAGDSARTADEALLRDRTDIEGAIDAGLRQLRPGNAGELVVISDGHSTNGAPARALAAAQTAGVPVYWLAVARAPPAARTLTVDTPEAITLGQPVTVTITVASASRARVRVVATGADGERASGVLGLAGIEQGSLVLALEPRRAGPYPIATMLEDEATGQVLEEPRASALVEVRGPRQVLYIARAPGPFAASLAAGGYALERVVPERAPGTAQALDRYDAAVLENVAIGDAPEAFWAALASSIRQRGLGLIVLGGPDAFAAGDYRGSTLESVLPVLAEPAPQDPAIALAFIVDKSGSMGRSSSGVDHLSIARAAVLATAQGLTARDRAALIVFDTDAQVLLPLAGATEALAGLEAPWPVAASGGTRIAPALSAAAEILSNAGNARRIAVLATDGFVGEESLGAAREALAAARVELVVLAIGGDAEVRALGELTRGSGELLRVGESAELPQVMRRAVARRVSRIVRGPVAVRQVGSIPFLPAERASWPDVHAYAAVRARPGASVPLEAASGDPLLALMPVGIGRSVALPGGLGAWSAPWLRSPGWPAFTGGLVEWVARGSSDRSLAVSIEEREARLVVEADVAEEHGWSGAGEVAMQLRDPAGRAQMAAATSIAPGRYRANFAAPAPGAYAVTVTTGNRRIERSYLHRATGEDDLYGLSPDLAKWQAAGLIRAWAQGGAAPRVGDAEGGRARSALLALALFLGAFLIDCRAVWLGRARQARLLASPRRHAAL